MSDNMEREKERLSAREIEEEKMKDELTGIGMWETGMSYEEMKTVYEVIIESKDTSNASNNKNAEQETQHIDNECLPEMTSDANEAQEASQKCVELPRPSYSYRQNHTSPTTHERKTARYSNSPEPPSRNQYRVISKSSDSDEIFENTNSTHNTNRYSHALRSGSAARECQNATERKSTQDTQVELPLGKLERWRLNPLDAVVDVNDVPLPQPKRLLTQERAPFGYCKEVRTAEQRDQLTRAVSQQLMETAKLRCAWLQLPAVDSVFQWGSPIQVGIANGSLDKMPLTDPKTEQIKAECTYKDSFDRASKRKASARITRLQNPGSSTDDEDENRRGVARAKKKKIQPDSKASNVAVANQHTGRDKATPSVSSRQQSSLIDDNSGSDFDNSDLKSLLKHSRKRKTNEEKEKSKSPELVCYPRRIIPPVPKARLSLHRNKRGSAASRSSPKTRPIEQTKKEKKLTDEEIRWTLYKDWQSDEDESAAAAKDVEIRPLPISQEVQSRLQEKRSSLNKVEPVNRETGVSVKGEGNDEGSRERNGKRRSQPGEQRRQEKNSSRTENGNWENLLLSDDEKVLSDRIQTPDVQNGNHSEVAASVGDINCPICNKLFSHNEIENHAANCEQYETNNESDDSNAKHLECSVCNIYKTRNAMDYEEHVHHCVIKSDKHSRGHEDVDLTPTSSYRTFKPISEQKDSEIDYLGQFVSDSKTKIPNGKKRKR